MLIMYDDRTLMGPLVNDHEAEAQESSFLQLVAISTSTICVAV